MIELVQRASFAPPEVVVQTPIHGPRQVAKVVSDPVMTSTEIAPDYHFKLANTPLLGVNFTNTAHLLSSRVLELAHAQFDPQQLKRHIHHAVH